RYRASRGTGEGRSAERSLSLVLILSPFYLPKSTTDLLALLLNRGTALFREYDHHKGRANAAQDRLGAVVLHEHLVAARVDGDCYGDGFSLPHHNRVGVHALVNGKGGPVLQLGDLFDEVLILENVDRLLHQSSAPSYTSPNASIIFLRSSGSSTWELT